MPLEAKAAPRPAKVASRLYPTQAHRVNYALGSKIEVGKVDPCGYNCAPQAMTRADKSKCWNIALAAGNGVCLGAVICSLFAGLLLTTKLGVTISNGRHASALENSISEQLPGCITESPFFKGLPKGFRWPDLATR